MNTFLRVVIGLLLLVANTVAAQNLVPNGSFEEYIDCPSTLDMLGSHCVGWFSSRGTCDYYNGCKGDFGVSVPANVSGYQEALTGQAYAGFVSTDVPELSYREHMSIQLLEALVVGQEYFFSMYVCSGFVLEQSPNKASNGQGAFFTTVHHSSLWDDDPEDNPSPVLNNPPVLNLEIISDSTNWVQLKGSFIADSAYTYLVLGGFLDGSTIEVENVTGEGPFENNGEAYYFVDEVRLSVDSLYAWELLPTSIDDQWLRDVKVFPNPFSETLHLRTAGQLSLVRLLDMRGRSVYENFIGSGQQIVISTESLLPDVYVLQLETTDGRPHFIRVVKN